MKATAKLWIMKSASGALVASTCSYTRKGVIEKVSEMHSALWPWRRLYRNGARIVRIKATEI